MKQKSIHQEYVIAAPLSDVWQALVDSDQIEAWSGSPVQMSDQEDAEFTLWDGDIYGRNKEIIPEEKLVQEWYYGDWEEPSSVTITLFEDDNGTRLELDQEDIPAEEYDSIVDGWKEYYLGPMKEHLENK